MPATSSGKSTTSFVLGVDGCKNGWVIARLTLETMALELSVRATFGEILKREGRGAARIMVDIPIGLAETGRRECEAMARRRLRPKRSASIFPSPRRPMLDFQSYRDANEWGKRQGREAGGGLSKQAWNITPKIREVDALMTPRRQKRISEAHPEVAFSRLNRGTPCHHSKHTPIGLEERMELLRGQNINDPQSLYEELRHAHGPGVSLDDGLDAIAVALTAGAALSGDAMRLTDGARDARGLMMEIWG